VADGSLQGVRWKTGVDRDGGHRAAGCLGNTAILADVAVRGRELWWRLHLPQSMLLSSLLMKGDSGLSVVAWGYPAETPSDTCLRDAAILEETTSPRLTWNISPRLS